MSKKKEALKQEAKKDTAPKTETKKDPAPAKTTKSNLTPTFITRWIPGSRFLGGRIHYLTPDQVKWAKDKGIARALTKEEQESLKK